MKVDGRCLNGPTEYWCKNVEQALWTE